VRDFIKTDLNMPEMENTEIEQAHRIMSRDPNKCTIIEPGHVYYWTSPRTRFHEGDECVVSETIEM